MGRSPLPWAMIKVLQEEISKAVLKNFLFFYDLKTDTFEFIVLIIHIPENLPENI